MIHSVLELARNWQVARSSVLLIDASTVDYLIVHLDGTAKNLCIKLDMHKALVTLV